MTQKEKRDPINLEFEFEKLKFEIEFFSKNLLTRIGEIGSFEDRLLQFERELPEWKKRVKIMQDEINIALGRPSV